MPDEENGPELEQRVPQASEGAATDRRLSRSGKITPAEPNQDVELIERVHERLRDLDSSPDLDSGPGNA